ncbi:MAG: YigZ family protein [Candidatus Marinimicrobia bacterium]|nr:YigZ family protein [Candidatus Neomarinimicrobiota bacterium]
MIKQKSLNQVLQGNFFDRGSKFYGFIHPISSLENYKSLIKKYKENNPEACHVCSAYRIYLNGWVDEYATDDGEPNGSAGLPILNTLKKHKLVNVSAYVVRIYGGVNLGIPGLINAYGTCIDNAIDDDLLIDWYPMEKVIIEYSYDLEKIINHVIKLMDAKIIKQIFEKTISLEIAVRENKKNIFLDLLNEKTSGKVVILK